MALAEKVDRLRQAPPWLLEHRSVPGEDGDRLDDLPHEPAEICHALLEEFDRQQQVGAAARLVARYLLLGHPPKDLLAMLVHALLREDAVFHVIQMLEAGVRQYEEWGPTDQGRHVRIAVARHLAAHAPTERSAFQTAGIARLAMRGGRLHEEVERHRRHLLVVDARLRAVRDDRTWRPPLDH